MTISFVHDIASALKDYGVSMGLNISDSIYEDLAWGGLDFENNSQLSADDKTRISDRLVAEQTNTIEGTQPPAGQKITCQ